MWAAVQKSPASVAIAGREGVVDKPAPEQGQHLVDAFCDRPPRLEPESCGKLFEADTIIAWIFVPVHELDLPSREALAKEFDEVKLPVVLAGVTDVEDFAVYDSVRGLEHAYDRVGSVSDVNVRPPELLAEDGELVFDSEIARELVHREVEAHPRRRTVDRRKAQACRDELPPAQRVLFRRDLRLCIERDRLELNGFVRKGAVAHPAVVAAGRCEDESVNAYPFSIVEQGARSIEIDLTGELRLPRAGWIANDCCEVDDRGDIMEGARTGRGMADVTPNKLEAGITPRLQQRRNASVQKGIERTHAVTACEELVNHDRPYVPGASGDEDEFGHVAQRPFGRNPTRLSRSR